MLMKLYTLVKFLYWD